MQDDTIYQQQIGKIFDTLNLMGEDSFLENLQKYHPTPLQKNMPILGYVINNWPTIA